jgi:hypothetical protein
MTTIDIIIVTIAIGSVLLISSTLLGISIYRHFNHTYKKKCQHKMFKELKKNDYIWKLCGDYIEPMRITEVRYYFDKQDDIQEIYISTSDWTTLHLKPQQTNTFKIKEGTVEYYTIFVEAETKRQLTEMKRNKSINDFNTINQEEKINELNREIQSLEQLKKDTIDKLQIKL